MRLLASGAAAGFGEPVVKPPHKPREARTLGGVGLCVQYSIGAEQPAAAEAVKPELLAMLLSEDQAAQTGEAPQLEFVGRPLGVKPGDERQCHEARGEVPGIETRGPVENSDYPGHLDVFPRLCGHR